MQAKEMKEIRGILHCHSTYSYDARISLHELKEILKGKGLQFVCMTEHTDKMTNESALAFVEECTALSDDTFCFIPGFEVPYRKAHVLMIGARNFCGNFARSGEELATWAQSAKFVVLAHPIRNNFEVDATLLAHLDGLEIWNQQYDGKRVPRIRSLKLFKTLFTKKPSIVATGGVDLHRTEHVGAPMTTLLVSEFTEDAIIEKLRTGAFTVSSNRALVYGSLPNADEFIQKHRFESTLSVAVIVMGKAVNRMLKSFGFSLPKSLARLIRTRL